MAIVKMKSQFLPSGRAPAKCLKYGQMDTKTAPRPSEIVELPLHDQLRKFIAESNLSQYDLSQKSGVPASTISRFMSSRQGGLQFNSAARLAKELGLKLVIERDEVVCHPSRSKQDNDILLAELPKAKHVIRILTSNPGTRIQTYVGAIMEAVERDRDEVKKKRKPAGERLHVWVLASDPKNPSLASRAEQLGATHTEYEKELKKLLTVIAGAFEADESPGDDPTCQLRVYKSLPIQLWTQVDDVLYVHMPSLHRRSRDNCMFQVPVHLPGVEETFLLHFEQLWQTARHFER